VKVGTGVPGLGVALILGAVSGVGILAFSDAELKWLIVPIGFMTAAFVFVVSRDPRAILLGIFILSLQLDLRIWIFHGHALSGGLYIPLAVLCGTVLAVQEFLRRSPTTHSYFIGPGALKAPIIVLFLAITISVALSAEHFAGVIALTEHLYYVFLYLLILNVVRTKNDFQYVIRLLFITVCIQSLVSFIQASLGLTFTPTGEAFETIGVTRVLGTASSNPAGFASFLIPPLMISVALLLAKDVHPRALTLAAAFLGATAIGFSFTRAAWIGLGLGYCAIAFLLALVDRLNWRRFLIGLTAAAAGILALLPRMLERITPDYTLQGSFDERLGLMTIAFRMIQEKPIFGFGAGSYQHVFKPYAYGLDQWIFVVHNEFLLRAAETGIPGALAFIWILWTGWTFASRLAKSNNILLSTVAVGWLGARVALVWQMQWVPWNGFGYNAMLWLSLGVIQAGLAIGSNSTSPSTPHDLPRPLP
jgi:putative inorganic carbon (HCO3(-)) transporter